MTIDFQKIADRFESSSQEIKDLMLSSKLSDKLEEIAENNKLEEEKYLSLVDEVGYVVLGLKEKSSFVNSLKETGMTPSEAEGVSKQVDSDIFSKLNQKSSSSQIKNEETRKIRAFLMEKIGNTPDIIQKQSIETQSVLSDQAWQDRTKEIATKYSLNPVQTENLTDEVLKVLLDRQNKTNFAESLTTSLGISKLLSGQISEDSEVRVFDYVRKTIENKEKRKNPEAAPVQRSEEIKKPLSEVMPVQEVKKQNILKPIVPPIVSVPQTIIPPVAKEAPVAKVQTESTYRPISVVPEAPAPKLESASVDSEVVGGGSKIKYMPRVVEPVQKPIAVPRFTAEPMEEEITSEVTPAAPTPQPVSSPQSAMDAKLTSVVSGQNEKPVVPPTHKYVVDPYREPLA